jgi:hypothetical protein
MTVRNIQSTDKKALEAISIDFPFPDIENPLYMAAKVIEDDGKVIGAAFIRLTSEAILVMDETTPKRTRVEGVEGCFNALQQEIKALGMDECHAFVRAPNIAKLLTKLGFKFTRSGHAMVIHF